MAAVRIGIVVVLGVALGVALHVASAQAAPRVDPRAAALFDEGRAFAKAGDFAQACARFEASYGLEPAPGTEMNLADCAEHLGQLRRAWHLFTAAAAALDRAADSRAPFAHQRAAALVGQLVSITVRLAEPLPEGLVVTINRNGEPAGAEVQDLVEPGTIDIAASAPDHLAVLRTVTGTAGATLIVELAPLVAAPRPVLPPPPMIVRARRRSWRYGASGVVGAGVVTEIVAGFVALSARGDHRDLLASGACHEVSGVGLECTPAGARTEDKLGRRANVASGLTIAGAALIVGGALLYLEAPRDTELRVAPIASGHAIGLSLGRAF